MENLNDIFREEEDRLLAEQRAEIATIDAAWQALTQAERDAAIADWEARYPNPVEASEEDEEDEEEDYTDPYEYDDYDDAYDEEEDED